MKNDITFQRHFYDQYTANSFLSTTPIQDVGQRMKEIVEIHAEWEAEEIERLSGVAALVNTLLDHLKWTQHGLNGVGHKIKLELRASEPEEPRFPRESYIPLAI